MRRVADNIYQLDSGLYQVRILLGWRYSKAGKRIRNRVKRAFERQADAVEFRDEARRQHRYRSAGVIPPEGQRTVTLGDAAAAHLAEIDLLGRTQGYRARERRYCATILNALGAHRDLPLRREDTVALIAWIRRHHKTQGALTRAVLATVSALHKRSDLPPPSRPEIVAPPPRKRRLPLADLTRFLSALPPASIERTVALTILMTGGRRAEIHRLRRGDVDLEAGTITLDRKKGARGGHHGPKVVGIAPLLARELHGYLRTLPELAPEAWLFSLSPDRSQHLQNGSLWLRVREASIRAGFDPPIVGLGWLRNEAGTLLDELGIEPRVIQRVLGHASFATTEAHYAQGTRAKAQATALGQLESLLKRGIKKGQRSGAPPKSPSKVTNR